MCYTEVAKAIHEIASFVLSPIGYFFHGLFEIDSLLVIKVRLLGGGAPLVSITLEWHPCRV